MNNFARWIRGEGDDDLAKFSAAQQRQRDAEQSVMIDDMTDKLRTIGVWPTSVQFNVDADGLVRISINGALTRECPGGVSCRCEVNDEATGSTKVRMITFEDDE